MCCEFLVLSMWEILFKYEILLIHNYSDIIRKGILRGFHCTSVIIIVIIHSVTFLPMHVYLSFISLFQDKFSLLHVVIFSPPVLFTQSFTGSFHTVLGLSEVIYVLPSYLTWPKESCCCQCLTHIHIPGISNYSSFSDAPSKIACCHNSSFFPNFINFLVFNGCCVCTLNSGLTLSRCLSRFIHIKTPFEQCCWKF